MSKTFYAALGAYAKATNETLEAFLFDEGRGTTILGAALGSRRLAQVFSFQPTEFSSLGG
ncbi:hypothetical protein PG996_006217 [Apiospora saccharicola]|uniref:Uncharacterized protein n=1 Tax=Apiospora saccharicola TaxID=335842 RepID=A0ABR1VNN3_9PEZI